LSFKLTSNPPPDRGSTRCVGAYDHPNAGSFGDGALVECGKPKARGSIDDGAAIESLAARSSSPAQSMGRGTGWPSSLGDAGLGSMGDEGVEFGRTDRRERGAGFLTEVSGAMIVGATNTN